MKINDVTMDCEKSFENFPADKCHQLSQKRQGHLVNKLNSRSEILLLGNVQKKRKARKRIF